MSSTRKRRCSTSQPAEKYLSRVKVADMPDHRSSEALAGITDDKQRVANVLMFPFCGDSRSPLTGPRVSDRDLQRAQKIMGYRPATAGHCRRDVRVERYELAAAA